MKIHKSRATLFASLLLGLLLMGIANARAYSYAGGAMYLDGVYIFPTDNSGEAIFNNPWMLSVSSAANGSTSASDSQGGTDEGYMSQSLVNEADGSSVAAVSCCGPFSYVNSTSGGISGAYNANGFGKATIGNTFFISNFAEQPGNVAVSFEADVFFAAFAESFLPGNSAGGSAYFKMFLNGGGFTEELVLNQLISAESLDGAGSFGDFDADPELITLSQELNLEYGTEYTLRLELSASSYAISNGAEEPCACDEEPVPEASTILATSIGFGLLALRRFAKRARA